jgi:hypothetical protein
VFADDADDPAVQPEVRFVSSLTSDVTFSGTTIPRNPNRIDLTVHDSTRVASCVVEASSVRQYDQVEAVGERIISCFTIANSDGSLVKGWTEDVETAFKAGASILADGSANPEYAGWSEDRQKEENNRVRGDDRLAAAFSQFKIPDDWDFKSTGGQGAPTTPLTVHVVSSVRGGGEIERLGGLFSDRYQWRHPPADPQVDPPVRGRQLRGRGGLVLRARRRLAADPGFLAPTAPPGRLIKPLLLIRYPLNDGSGCNGGSSPTITFTSA